MSDDCVSREKAREPIQAGTLPRRAPKRTWGGPGVGADCAICNVPVNRDELELEIEYERDDKVEWNGNDDTLDKYHVHVGCFMVWEHERHTLEQAPGPPSPRAAPSESTPVSPPS